MHKNYYQILGLNPNCTKDEIKKAYKSYALKFHPDKHGNDTFFEERFKEIKEAYDILNDEFERKKIDSFHKSSNYYNSSSSSDQYNSENFRQQRAENEKKKKEQEKKQKEENELKESQRKNIYYVDDKITINGISIFINNRTYKISDVDLALVKKSDSSDYKSYAIILIILGVLTFTFIIGVFFLASGIAGLFYKDYVLILYCKENDIPIIKGKKKYLNNIATKINLAIKNR
jgi:curved DNA-binding protein CbpA